MKISIALAILATIGTGTFSVQHALATTTHHAAAPKTLKIVMHDPGCHWFQVGTKFTKTATANGAIRLVNLDEATLKVNSGHGVQRIAVGKSLLVRSGHYAITMVHQASDDNHLKLTVR